MSGLPQISILIPTWNSLPLLQMCLASIERHSTLKYQLVVHVNQGTDGTCEWLQRKGIEFTHSAQNVGICAGLNQAYLKAKADYIVYLNDDMYVLPGWDRELMRPFSQADPQEPLYVSGTMIQFYSMSPSILLRDYGQTLDRFDQNQLLADYYAEQLISPDWNGATWPPSCVHRQWWDRVGGYSEDFSPGFYSDIDFSMKLWQLGCRRFYGCGKSLVYHLGEQTTQRVRGEKNHMVRQARKHFLNKWGILPSTATRYYLHAGESLRTLTPEPRLGWEKIRVGWLYWYYHTESLLQKCHRRLSHPATYANQEP